MARTDSTLNNTAASCATPAPRQVEKSLIIVQREHPLDTLPFISDALIFMSSSLLHKPELSQLERRETGAGLLLELLAYAIDDVQEALNEKEKVQE